MTAARTFALQTVRQLLSKLPLPLATPVNLARAVPSPSPKSLAFKRLAVVGRGAPEAAALSDFLQECGARVEMGSSTDPADGVIAVLGERPSYDDLAGLHGALSARVSALTKCGRVLVVSRCSSPVVTGGVHGFVRSLARELGRRGVTVNAVMSEDISAVCPLTAFLLSERASYISGQSVLLAPGPAPASTSSTPMLAVVTGASRGIGAAITRILAASGYRVAMLDVAEQAEAGQTVCDSLGGEPAGMSFVACDVRDDASVDQTLERVRSLSPLGTIDVLVNNAGITRDRTFAKMSPDAWGDVLGVDLGAVMHVTRRALTRMAPGGRVINVASVTGLAGNFGQTNYAAAKGGVVGFTLQAGKELESRGICVTAVAPGLIETAMTDAMPVVQREIAKQLISLAQAGLPEDVAMAVEFLARREAWPLRGQALRVDGGMFFGP